MLQSNPYLHTNRNATKLLVIPLYLFIIGFPFLSLSYLLSVRTSVHSSGCYSVCNSFESYDSNINCKQSRRYKRARPTPASRGFLFKVTLTSQSADTNLPPLSNIHDGTRSAVDWLSTSLSLSLHLLAKSIFVPLLETAVIIDILKLKSTGNDPFSCNSEIMFMNLYLNYHVVLNEIRSRNLLGKL